MSVSPEMLQTKLRPPHPPFHNLPLPRLMAILEQSCDYQLTLVCAPAGYGKSTLMAAWFGGLTSEQAGWLSLDSDDNNAYRLLLHLVAALECVDPALLARLRAESEGETGQLLAQWINALLSYDGNLTLVVDEVHLLVHADAQQLLATLIQHQPPNLRLILGGRHRPEWLPLGRLDLEEELLEVGEPQLRLTHDEASVFAQQLGLALKQVSWTQHQGWVMGLRMMALAGQGGAEQRSHRYFFNEIFRRLTAEQQQFLTHCALLDRLNGKLCQAVTGSDKSTIILKQLYEQGVFITPLQRGGNALAWYACHPMFLGFLRATAAESLDEHLLDELHQRAARWFVENSMAVAALSYLKGVKDTSVLAELVEAAAWPLLKSGQFAQLNAWLEQIDLGKHTTPQLLVASATASTVMGSEYDALTTLDCLESLLESGQLDGVQQRLAQVQLRQLRGNVYLRQHRPQTVLDLLPGRMMRALPLPTHNKANIECNLGLALWMQMSPDDAQSHLAKSVHYSWQSEVPGRVAQSCTGLLQALLAAGQMEEALLRAAQCEHELVSRQWIRLPVMSQFYFVYSLLYRCRAETTLEISALEKCVECGCDSVVVPFRALASLAQGRIACLNGQRDDAREHWQKAYGLTLDISLSPSVLPAPLLLAELALQLDDYKRAVDQLQRLDKCGYALSPLNRYIQRYFHAKQLAAQSSSSAGLSYLLEEGVLPDIDDVLLYTRNALLAAELAMKSSDKTRAVEFLECALPVIGHAGWLGLFGEVGECVVELLTELAPQNDGAAAVRQAIQGKQCERPRPGQGWGFSYEALNTREQQILGLLAGGYSNKEISEQVHLSLNTVKTHLKNLYLKLDVRSRIQAVKRGEQLKLI